MAFLKPGTLCVAVGGSGENAGCIVRIISYTGLCEWNPTITEGYQIETASDRPFAAVKQYVNDGTRIVRNKCWVCFADRRNLRPLVDPKVKAEERTGERLAPHARIQDVVHDLVTEE